MTGPAYVSVVALHVLAAVVGFGALGATGSYAAALGRDPSRAETPSMRRFFRPGRNWAARAVLAVPLLGGALLALGHGQDVGRAFPWIGLGLWTIAVAVAATWLWPAERAIQRLVAASATAAVPEPSGVPGGAPAPASAPSALDAPALDAAALQAACRRCGRAAAVTSLCFFVALVVMVVQP